MNFEDKLRRVIKTKYNRLSDLAEKFDMNYSQLSQYLNGKKISIEFLLKIIEEFPETDLNWLLRENTDLHPVYEEHDAYKQTLNNEEIIKKIEALLVELKTQMKKD